MWFLNTSRFQQNTPFKKNKTLYFKHVFNRTLLNQYSFTICIPVWSSTSTICCSLFWNAKMVSVAFTNISSALLKCGWMPVRRNWKRQQSSCWGEVKLWWSHWDANRKRVLFEQFSVENVLETYNFLFLNGDLVETHKIAQQTYRKPALSGLACWYFQGNNLPW